MRTERSNAKPLAAFIARKTEIDAMLARFVTLSDGHFGYAPDEINWGYLGTLASHAELLQRIIDAAFQEGGHSEGA